MNSHTSGVRLFVSGLYSGPSPSAGLGVARCLRSAFPSAELIGVDYWAGSSGLHHEVFNETWLKPSWDLVEEGLYAEEIRAELDRGALWIPTLDLEVSWLTRALAHSARVLAPQSEALAATVKPRVRVAELLGLNVAPSLDLSASDAEIHGFCREHSWRVWLKGPYHEAVFVSGWPELLRARQLLVERWQTERLSIQAHVRGYEESICLSALGGELIDAIYMRKRITTPDGKTWAGRVTEIPSDLLGRVRAAVRDIGWSGGAEIELLRDIDGRLWFLECNPRFPGWIYGAALAGHNLPAALVRRSLGLPDSTRPARAHSEFTRVVLEVPARTDLPLPLPGEPEHGAVGAFGKYGAGLAAIVKKLSGAAAERSAPPAISRETLADLSEAARVERTPARLFLPRTAAAAFSQVASRELAPGVRLRHAYSLKTTSDPKYLAMARQAGMLAECISQLEVQRALKAGFRPDEVVLNGPGKWWPEDVRAADGLAAVFCDSLEEFARASGSGRKDRALGIRLRIPGFKSRFGVRVDEPQAFERLCALVSKLPPGPGFGVHMHLASTAIGVGHWRDAVESAVVWATSLEASTGRPVTLLDLGGGYHPGDFARIPFAEIGAFAARSLPALRQIYVEPGRALTQETMAVVTRVLDVRRSGGEIEDVVVDASIAELPLASVHPHRILWLDGDRWVPLSRGPTRVLGRICMEDDILSTGLALPAQVAVGDRLVVCDAGAYERSMSYEFGCAGYSRAS